MCFSISIHCTVWLMNPSACSVTCLWPWHSCYKNLKGKIWNFLFYKFIFLFGVLNVQTERELAMWCLWCSALLFLQLLAQLCKVRFEYVSKYIFSWYPETQYSEREIQCLETVENTDDLPCDYPSPYQFQVEHYK